MFESGLFTTGMWVTVIVCNYKSGDVEHGNGCSSWKLSHFWPCSEAVVNSGN